MLVEKQGPFSRSVGLDVASVPSLAQRLNAVRAEVTYVQKSSRIDGKFNAVSHGEVLRKVRASSVKHGIVWWPESTVVLHREIVHTTTRKGDERLVFWTQCAVTFRVESVDDAEDFRLVQVVADGMDDQDKGAGKASTYADKTMMVRFFNLESGDDPDFDERDLTPQIDADRRAFIDRVAELAALIEPSDPDSVIVSMLGYVSEKFTRSIKSVLGVPNQLFPELISMLETKAGVKKPEKKGPAKKPTDAFVPPEERSDMDRRWLSIVHIIETAGVATAEAGFALDAWLADHEWTRSSLDDDALFGIITSAAKKQNWKSLEK